jgi:hypothetical protein
MTPIAIQPPVKVKTKGGLAASIFELVPGDMQDGLSGMVYTPAMGDIPKSWSDVGICSNASDDLNIDPHEPAVAALIAKLHAARSLK